MLEGHEGDCGPFLEESDEVTQAIIEVERRIRGDRVFRKMVEKLEKDLSKQAKKKYFITIA